MSVISLSLISHTNVGKTTLARTLLRRDVGAVVDAPHVTELAEEYELVTTTAGDVLRLWDTPGFGDSARLLKRLQQSANPLGWLVTQVWDRYTDRPLYCSQQAIRNVRDEADIVLYLVNASEDPASAGYISPEMHILGWTGKPVLVLLNQLGAPRPANQESAEVERWSRALEGYPFVRDVIPFDAFARCWVQEHALLGRIGRLLPEDARVAFARIDAAWHARNEKDFRASMNALALELAATAADKEPVKTSGRKAKVAYWIRNITRIGGKITDAEAAIELLASRADTGIRQATDRLIQIHGLGGHAADEIRARMATDVALDAPVDEVKPTIISGLLSGALGGLTTDLMSGGLTAGAGALIGAVVGAAGAWGVARSYNLVRGSDAATVRWSQDVLTRLAQAAVLRYLAVAHFGRGRGDFVESEYPPHWRPVVAVAMDRESRALSAIWAAAEKDTLFADLRVRLESALTRVVRGVLAELYPGQLPEKYN